MKETVAVLGANGVYARHLIPRLAASGHPVRAIVRRPEAAAVARACGAQVVLADIFDTSSMTEALAGCAIGVNLATSLPGPSGRGDHAANDRLRREGTANWVDACRQAGVGRVIQQSIGMVNGAGGDRWSDEDTVFSSGEETIASNAIAATVRMERWITESDLDWLILRGGLFYGPGTGFDDGWHARAAAGKLRLPGNGEDYVSLVHVEDMAAATVRAIEAWPSQQALIVCDDQPAPWRDVFGFIAALNGQPEPQPGGQSGFPSFRLRNRRAREALGWTPFHATYRSGLVR